MKATTKLVGPGGIEVELIILDGVPTFRVKKHRCLLGKGYFRTIAELQTVVDISTLKEV